jgi:hypothetical protein
MDTEFQGRNDDKLRITQPYKTKVDNGYLEELYPTRWESTPEHTALDLSEVEVFGFNQECYGKDVADMILSISKGVQLPPVSVVKTGVNSSGQPRYELTAAVEQIYTNMDGNEAHVLDGGHKRVMAYRMLERDLPVVVLMNSNGRKKSKISTRDITLFDPSRLQTQ